MLRNILELLTSMPNISFGSHRTGPGVRRYPKRMIGVPAGINRHECGGLYCRDMCATVHHHGCASLSGGAEGGGQ